MGKIIVTGASGQFGNAAAKMLLERVPAEDLVFLSRTPERLAEFAETGAHIRRADFDDASTLPAAMEGGERMLLISTVRVGSRVEQHTAAVEAAAARGVKHVVYTSLLGVRTPGNPSVEGFDHIATERMIEASGLAWTHLRDSLYAEAVATAMAIPALQAGHKPENAGQGCVPIVSRDDCVATAVGALTQDGHANKAYDVTGPDVCLFRFARGAAQGVRRGAGRPDPLGERRHGHVRPVDPRGLHGHRVERRRTHHRPPAAHAPLGVGTVPANVAEMRKLALFAALALAACNPVTSDKPQGDTLRGHQFDHVFGDLIRDASGKA